MHVLLCTVGATAVNQASPRSLTTGTRKSVTQCRSSSTWRDTRTYISPGQSLSATTEQRVRSTSVAVVASRVKKSLRQVDAFARAHVGDAPLGITGEWRGELGRARHVAA